MSQKTKTGWMAAALIVLCVVLSFSIDRPAGGYLSYKKGENYEGYTHF